MTDRWTRVSVNTNAHTLHIEVATCNCKYLINYYTPTNHNCASQNASGTHAYDLSVNNPGRTNLYIPNADPACSTHTYTTFDA